MSEKATTWENLRETCQLATPHITLARSGQLIAIEDDLSFLSSVNESLWIGYYKTFGIFQLRGEKQVFSKHHHNSKNVNLLFSAPNIILK